jgi:acetyltransferase-like isoleucine patch superfamily enzyme
VHPVGERALSRRVARRLGYWRRTARTQWCLRRNFTSHGPRGAIFGAVRFLVDGTAIVGEHFVVEGYDAKVSIKVAEAASLIIGDDVFLNGGVSIEAWREVRIGSNVLMAPYASIIDDDRHEMEPGARRDKGPVIVGDNVWLGRNVAVLPGVRIGDGSVIGANSVVSRDIPAGCFAAGAPARVIRNLDRSADWVRR